MTPQILLVDDDRAALYALTEVLSDLPVRIVLAESGEEALRQVLKQEFAAILLDVRLPNMDGFEVAAAIRSLERLRRTPILFMSANEDRRRKPRPSAHEHYFRKPLAPGAVRAKVASFLPLAPAMVDAQQPRARDRVS
ncbi:MAG TPA: response regulator [Burkholderiales bacterium]